MDELIKASKPDLSYVKIKTIKPDAIKLETTLILFPRLSLLFIIVR